MAAAEETTSASERLACAGAPEGSARTRRSSRLPPPRRRRRSAGTRPRSAASARANVKVRCISQPATMASEIAASRAAMGCRPSNAVSSWSTSASTAKAVAAGDEKAQPMPERDAGRRAPVGCVSLPCAQSCSSAQVERRRHRRCAKAARCARAGLDRASARRTPCAAARRQGRGRQARRRDGPDGTSRCAAGPAATARSAARRRRARSRRSWRNPQSCR